MSIKVGGTDVGGYSIWKLQEDYMHHTRLYQTDGYQGSDILDIVRRRSTMLGLILGEVSGGL